MMLYKVKLRLRYKICVKKEKTNQREFEEVIIFKIFYGLVFQVLHSVTPVILINFL